MNIELIKKIVLDEKEARKKALKTPSQNSELTWIIVYLNAYAERLEHEGVSQAKNEEEIE